LQHPLLATQHSFKQTIFPFSTLQQVLASQQSVVSHLQQAQGQMQHLFNLDSKSQQVLF